MSAAQPPQTGSAATARDVMRKNAEEAIARRAMNNDASLVEAIIPDPHSEFVCVSPAYIASLPELVAFSPMLEAGQREKFLVSVLESSEHLHPMKDKDGKTNAIRTEYKRNPRNTLLMHGVPGDAKESDLRELFLSVPTAASVSFKKDVNSCWLATFDTEANAVATHRELIGKKLTIKDSVISIGLRATRFVRVNPAAATPAQPAAAAQPIPYNGMRQQGMPQNMRQQYPYPQQQYWVQMQPYWQQQMYMQPRPGGQHQPYMMQQKSRSRGGHPRYPNPAPVQQQRTGGSEPAPVAARVDPAAASPAAPAPAPATTAPKQQQQQQQQQQGRDGSRSGGGRSGRGSRGRSRGAGGNRGHGGQSSAASESAPADAPAQEQHPKHQRQSAAERQEQPAKPQEKPTPDSFPPLA